MLYYGTLIMYFIITTLHTHRSILFISKCIIPIIRRMINFILFLIAIGLLCRAKTVFRDNTCVVLLLRFPRKIYYCALRESLLIKVMKNVSVAWQKNVAKIIKSYRVLHCCNENIKSVRVNRSTVPQKPRAQIIKKKKNYNNNYYFYYCCYIRTLIRRKIKNSLILVAEQTQY